VPSEINSILHCSTAASTIPNPLLDIYPIFYHLLAFETEVQPVYQTMNINMMEKEASSSKHSREHKSKHHKHREDDPDRKHKKRHRHDDEEESSSRKKHHKHHKKDKEKSKDKKGHAEKKMDIVDDDPNDENMWQEKDIDMDGERVRKQLSLWLLR
jgi:hypothetical protein